MAIDLQNDLADILLAAFAAEFPAGALLQLRSGAAPGPENAATGTLLAEITLPATPWDTSTPGVLAKNNTWEDPAANAAGTLAHYRLRNAAGTLCIEGTITGTGGGGDLTVDNVVTAVGQVVTITSFQYTL